MIKISLYGKKLSYLTGYLGGNCYLPLQISTVFYFCYPKLIYIHAKYTHLHVTFTLFFSVVGGVSIFKEFKRIP